MGNDTATVTRDQIVTAGLQLFALRGFTATDIAEYLTVTPDAVHQHFPTKDAVLNDILEPALARINEILTKYATAEPTADPTVLVKDLIDAIADSGPQVAALLEDPAAGARVYSSATDSALTTRIELVLARQLARSSPETPTPKQLLREAHHMRAACAVAAIPAGITAWQEFNPAIPVIDAEARRTLVEIVLAILTPAARHHVAP